jgi:hypothetical protein
MSDDAKAMAGSSLVVDTGWMTISPWMKFDRFGGSQKHSD